ncbi:MAG: glycosyl hydrolase [Myxococcales bacterium]|nr:glycosyl hydrolase [Myxococcales bacterium]
MLAYLRRPLPLSLAALLTACSTGEPIDGSETDANSGPTEGNQTSVSPTTGASASTSTTSGGDTSTSGGTTSGGTSAGETDTGTTGGTEDALCPTEFRFKPVGAAQNPRVAGEWHGFDLASATALTGPDAQGYFTATVDLQPGLWAYKIVFDQGGEAQWILDPLQGRRKYVGDTENSAVKVRKCLLPTFDVDTSESERPSPGKGTYSATLSFVDGIEGSGADPAGFSAILDEEGATRALTDAELMISASGDVTIALGDLADGKYVVRLRGATQSGREGDELRLVFWIEAQPFTWDGALIYMVLTDRFRDGDPGNNPGATPKADPRGDWKGGDLEGLRKSIADGTLDKLGVRAIWLTPFQTNPSDAYVASDGFHFVTGYHGYWPIEPREVDPRLGGEAALHAMVKEAHKHGIRILQDYVVNHVHEEHAYMKEHPEWFRTGCVCGTDNCDWTGHALDCMFAAYLPDINHTVPEANAAFVDDAVWWLDNFNLDGLRVDAVKHVEEVATRNLSVEVRETFEGAGTHYFMMGETAMGWSDCADPCNDENYGTISRYIGPFGLDGQFDFVLYHGVSYRTFAHSDKGMLHADYWLKHGLEKWPAGSVMTPYIGSHDTPRFATLADYRGQDGAHDKGIPGNQWDNTAVEPSDGEPYERTRIGMAWLMGLPGAPLLYYGDEYGQWGGSDPNNRLLWRDEAALKVDEKATLAFVRKLGSARRTIPALQRGSYVTLDVDDDTLIFGRALGPGDAAIVALTRSGAPQMRTVDVNGLGFKSQDKLSDALGGPSVVVSVSGKIDVTVPAKGAIVLAP